MIALHAPGEAHACSIASVAAVCGRLGCHVNPMQVRRRANEEARQHYGTGAAGAVAGLDRSSPWRRCRSEGRWAAGASPDVVSRSESAECWLAEEVQFHARSWVAAKWPGLRAWKERPGRWHDAMPRRWPGLGRAVAPPHIARTGG